jgi:hypothetical protein
MDYGQKIEPAGNQESQSECFGKAGISQFGVTYLMLASGFSIEEQIEMLDEDRTNKLLPGDLVAFTTVLYNSDANQDWVHSFMS